MGFLFSYNCVKSAHFSSRWTTWDLRLEDQVWSEVERLCSLGEAATTSWRPGHFPWVSLSSVSSSTKQPILVALLRGMKGQWKLRVPVALQSSVRPCYWVSSWAPRLAWSGGTAAFTLGPLNVQSPASVSMPPRPGTGKGPLQRDRTSPHSAPHLI